MVHQNKFSEIQKQQFQNFNPQNCAVLGAITSAAHTKLIEFNNLCSFWDCIQMLLTNFSLGIQDLNGFSENLIVESNFKLNNYKNYFIKSHK